MLNIAGWLRHLRLRLQGRELLLSGKCRRCGSCCARIQIQQGRRWLRSKRAFRKLVKNYPEYGRFNIVGRDSHGLLLFACSWLQPDNTCLNHEQRLGICRSFPTKGIFFCGAQLPHGCGYRVDEVIPFARVLQEKIDTREERQ